MIIPLDKLINLKGNKYLITRAANLAIDRLGNIKGYPEDNVRGWKVVPCVLGMVLDDKIKFHQPAVEPETPEEA
jgi:hypothetical protein